jgi:hypothetical protein
MDGAIRQSTPLMTRWTLVLLALAGLSAALDPRERSAAFIGWNEGTDAPDARLAACRDRRESCEADASSNQCLTNPYVMRRVCPISCNVAPCAATGTAGQVSKRAKRRVRCLQGFDGHRAAAPAAHERHAASRMAPRPPARDRLQAAMRLPRPPHGGRMATHGAPSCRWPMRRLQAPFRHAGHATADGTWAFGDAFRADKSDKGVAQDHYNAVYYMEGKQGEEPWKWGLHGEGAAVAKRPGRDDGGVGGKSGDGSAGARRPEARRRAAAQREP